MKKYACYVCVMLGSVLILILIIVFLLDSTIHNLAGDERLNYEDAKAETIELFIKEKEEFLRIAEEIKDGENESDFAIRGIKTISCTEDEANKRVDFNKRSGSMLGGQYWGLYYNANNKPENEAKYSVKSGPYEGSFYWSEPNNGEDFLAMERIEECWFFYYFDFDGNSHGLDWAKK